MKAVFLALLLTCMFALAKSQALTDFKFTPSAPTIDDSVQVDFLLVFPWFEAKKQMSTLSVTNDTIVYVGCYYKPGFAQMETYVYDTFNLGKLNAGYYELFVLRNFVFSYQDTDCLNIAYTDTLDTFFVVTEPNIIIEPRTIPLNALLLTRSRLIVECNGEEPIDIDILDVNGRICFSLTEASIRTGVNQIQLQIPQLPAGVYFYRIKSGNKIKVIKWVER